jgi:hypothetical protein
MDIISGAGVSQIQNVLKSHIITALSSLRKHVVSLLLLEAKTIAWYPVVCVPYLVYLSRKIDTEVMSKFVSINVDKINLLEEWIQLLLRGNTNEESSCIDAVDYMSICCQKVEMELNNLQSALFDLSSNKGLVPAQFRVAEAQINSDNILQLEICDIWHPQMHSLEIDGFEIVNVT